MQSNDQSAKETKTFAWQKKKKKHTNSDKLEKKLSSLHSQKVNIPNKIRDSEKIKVKTPKTLQRNWPEKKYN